MTSDLPGLLSGLAAIVTLPVGILVALFVGLEASVVVFVVGWLLLVPTIALVGEELLPAVRERLGERESEEPAADPLDELKRRYARGEISDEEFERRVENLIGTEDVESDYDANLERFAEHDVNRARE